MNWLYSIVIAAFIIRTLRVSLYLVFLWQLKEYRLDRLFAHLKTPIGRKLILGPFTIAKWSTLLFGSILAFFIPQSILAAYALFWGIWCLEAAVFILELVTRRWKIPALTMRIIPILLIVAVSEFSLLFIGFWRTTLLLAPVLDKGLAPLIACLVGLTSIPTYLYRKWKIHLAKRKMTALDKLGVIGITGSYGKTTVKHFLACILGYQFPVAAAAGSINTEIGIAAYILNHVSRHVRILIVEMGAYKKGEIQRLCKLVTPSVGIITAVGTQHLELFGSKNALMEAKYELLASLPEKGTAIVNGDDDGARQLGEWAEKRGVQTEVVYPSRMVRQIRTAKTHIACQVLLEGRWKDVVLPVLGGQALTGIMIAVAGAQVSGMKASDIISALRTVSMPQRTMKMIGAAGSTTLIDDTFNINPESTLAAVSYMKLYKGDKILVLSPFIELGTEESAAYERIAPVIEKECTHLVLASDSFPAYFRELLAKADNGTLSILSEFPAGTRKDSVAVFEGKEAGTVLKRIQQNAA